MRKPGTATANALSRGCDSASRMLGVLGRTGNLFNAA
jgi:hypothetical protein